MMDATERARLRALCEAATPGPWDAIYDEDAGEWMVRTGHADVAVLTWQQALDALGLSPVTMRTAAFIAASRTAIPALLDDSERLDAVTRERDEARAEVERLRAERDAAVARVRVLERELDAHAWRRAAWMALHMELSEPSTKDGAAWRASRSARRGAWMKSNNVSDAPKGRRRSWVGAWHEFFLRAAGKGSEWKDTEAWLSVAHRIEGDLPADHRDVFFRDGVPVCIVAEPYISSWRDSYHAAWEALAARYGLRLERSIAASWHCPGHTVLYVLWLPSQGGA